MTTYAYNTKIRHDSDAEFRAWASEIHTALTTVGCTQTADTGQINFTTVTRAAINTDAGYAIYYMNDSMHATAPIYFKLYFGTGGGTSTPRLRIEVGTGSNGSGTMTGAAAIRTISISGSPTYNIDTPYQSYCCMDKGCLWIMGKYGRGGTGYAAYGFIIMRNCDNTGAESDESFLVIYHTNATSVTLTVPQQTYNVGTSTWSSVKSDYPAFWFPSPYVSTAADSGANLQVVIPVYGMDQIRPLATGLLAMTADFTLGGTVTVTTIGATAFTFISIGRSLGSTVYSSSGVSTQAELMLIYQ